MSACTKILVAFELKAPPKVATLADLHEFHRDLETFAAECRHVEGFRIWNVFDALTPEPPPFIEPDEPETP